MVKKLIGLVLVLVLFFFAFKAVTFLPSFTNAVVGQNKSPFQIGTDYVNQINQIYPYNNYGNSGAPLKQQASYGTTNTNSAVLGKATLEKVSGKLVLSIENGNPRTALHVWLTNTPDITDKTSYIDFGQLRKSTAVQQYIVDMKGGDVSFAEYNTILIVDADNRIYARVNLK